MVEPGVRARQQAPIDAALVDAGEHAPSDCWRALANSSTLQQALIDAVRELLADVPHYARVRTLLDAGVTAAEGGYARHLAGLDRAPETDVHQRALDMTAQFGSGEVTAVGHRLDLEDLEAGPLAVFDAVDVTPTVAVQIGESFRDRRREHRKATCRLLARLAQTCSLVVVAGPVTTRWFAREHREQLPTSFSEEYSTPHQTHDTDAAVDAALDELDRNSRETKLLRDLAAEPDETRAYAAVRGSQDVSQSRISQLLAKLQDLGLVEKFGPRGNQRVELLPPGRELVDWLDSETAGQQTLNAEFSDSGQSSPSAVLSAPRTRAPPDGPGETATTEPDTDPYKTCYLGRSTHHAAAASTSDGSITAVRGPLQDEDADDRRTRYVSFDNDRDEAVVAVRAKTPVQYATSVALGLASPRFLDAALPPKRLGSIDDPPRILRQARCIGALSAEAVDDGETLRENLVEWGETLAEMTTKLKHGEYDDRDQFRGEILRTAHGLAGTLVHLLDVVGVDVVRELRVPATTTDDDLAALSRTVSIATAIQSKYRAFAAYRQLYEDRQGKREQALSPDVDAADPTGTYIGGLVVRGPRADRFAHHIEGHLAEPKSLHEDAPELSIRVSVDTPDRTAVAEAATRMLATKNLKSTREAVTLLHTFAATPHAVTEAIRWLGTDDSPRHVRLDELRLALAGLSPDRLLSGTPPTVRQAVSALLRTADPLSQSELATAADVSTRSLRRHLDILQALDLVRDTEDGYRLTLPYRGESRAPTPAALADDMTLQDVVFEATLATVSVAEAGRLGDPSDPLGKPFYGPRLTLDDLQPLLFARPNLRPWIDVASRLSGTQLHRAPTVEFGSPSAQQPLESSATAAAG